MASFSPSDVPFGMPLRSVMVQASFPRVTLAVISPSSVKFAYEDRISRPISLKLETMVSLAAMQTPWDLEGGENCPDDLPASIQEVAREPLTAASPSLFNRRRRRRDRRRRLLERNRHPGDRGSPRAD